MTEAKAPTSALPVDPSKPEATLRRAINAAAFGIPAEEIPRVHQLLSLTIQCSRFEVLNEISARMLAAIDAGMGAKEALSDVANALRDLTEKYS